MATTQQQDAGLVQRGLLLLGGMTALVVVVLLIVLRNPDAATKSTAARNELPLIPEFFAPAPYPASVGWPALVHLGQQLPSAPGWEIRYNAAATQARRGSPKTKWSVVREMLDEERQLCNFRVTLTKGQVVANEQDATRTVLNALAAVAEWHKKQDPATAPVSADLLLVYDQVDRLAQSGNTLVRVHADRVRQGFFRK
ncbi:MAG: hypothetical protein L0Y71_12240 [Gemmataceae bacterium]|nr:hypothetical protein [Gemmataceae bacterium]